VNSRRVRWLLVMAVILLAVVDFTRRIYVSRDVQPRGADSFVPADVAPPVSAATVTRDLGTWLPGLQPVAEGSGAAAPTDWSLTLLAVFSERGAPFAVIRATPAAGGTAKVQRIVEGDEVYGFKVAQIQPQRVRLEKQDGAQELQVFKPASSSVQGSGEAAAASVVGTSPMPVAQAAAPPAASAAAAAAKAPSSPAAAPVTEPKQVQPTELQPGQAFELPASMRGMKVVEAPVPPPKPDAGGKSAPRQAAPAPQKP
jgi:hypothetical protein